MQDTFTHVHELIKYPKLWSLSAIFCAVLHSHSAVFSQHKCTALLKPEDLALTCITAPLCHIGKLSVLLTSLIYTRT